LAFSRITARAVQFASLIARRARCAAFVRCPPRPLRGAFAVGWFAYMRLLRCFLLMSADAPRISRNGAPSFACVVVRRN
jgi:hypothetical protein